MKTATRQLAMKDHIGSLATLVILLFAIASILSTQIPNLHMSPGDAGLFFCIASGGIIFLTLYFLAASGMIFFPNTEKGKYAKKWETAVGAFPETVSFYQPTASGRIRDFYIELHAEHDIQYTEALSAKEFGLILRKYDEYQLTFDLYCYVIAKEDGLSVYVSKLVRIRRDPESGESYARPVDEFSNHKGRDALFLMLNH